MKELIFILLVCWRGVYRPTREFFTHMETSPLPVKGCKFLKTYARHLRPLSSEGSLTCHAYCDTGLPFIMVISEDPWLSYMLPSVWKWSCHYLFLRLRSVATGDQIPISHMGQFWINLSNNLKQQNIIFKNCKLYANFLFHAHFNLTKYVLYHGTCTKIFCNFYLNFSPRTLQPRWLQIWTSECAVKHGAYEGNSVYQVLNMKYTVIHGIGQDLLLVLLSYVKEENCSKLWYTVHQRWLWLHIYKKLFIPHFNALSIEYVFFIIYQRK